MSSCTNETGQVVLAFNVFRCWPTDYVAPSDLIADGEAAVATESITGPRPPGPRTLAGSFHGFTIPLHRLTT